jgi:hypothetical protein
MLALVFHATAWAQENRREAAPEQPAAAPAQGAAEALSVRYRFRETYGVEEDPTRPDLVTQYQVGIRESFKAVREKPQGAPDRVDWSTQTIYSERAAKVNKNGDVVDAIRRYDKFNQKGLISASDAAPLFQSLTVWVHRGAPSSAPQILNLTNDRPLRDAEFDLMVDQVSLPPLKALLPSTPRRVGDTWIVPRGATFYLFGTLPEPDDYDLKGTIKEVTKAASGNKLVALIGISGQVNLPDGPNSVNAEIDFTFEPPPPPAAPAAGEALAPAGIGAARGLAKSAKEGALDARGWITGMRMARSVEVGQPEGDGRLKTTETRQISLARRLLAAVPNQSGGGQPAGLALPNPPPTATEANSWLVYEDPQGRFHFRHPQLLKPLFGGQANPYEVHLADSRPEGGRDRLGILLQPKDAAAEFQLAFRDKEHFERAMNQEWARKKLDVLRGPADFLSGKEWDDSKRKVYRIEAGLKLKRDTDREEGRIFIDNYLVDFGHGQAIIVESWTDRDDHVSFRTEAEAVIKSFEFGPWKPHGSPAASSAPAPPPQ